MKKIISLLLALIIFVALFTLNVNAALPPDVCGDVDSNFDFDTVDVTLVQRYLADMIGFNDWWEKPMADFDHDGIVTVMDVTWMQRSLAGMNVPYGIGGEAEYWFYVNSFYASYESGKASVGVPVTFTAVKYDEYVPSFEFYVDGVLVQERSTVNTYTHTFENSGYYNIKVRVYNWQGFYEDKTIFDYQVVEDYPYDEFGFKSVRWRDLPGTSYDLGLIAEAMGGTGPYQYALELYRLEDWAYGSDNTTCSLTQEDVAHFNHYVSEHPDTDWGMYPYNDEGDLFLCCGFFSRTETDWDMSMLEWGAGYIVKVIAIDNAGHQAEEYIKFENGIVPG